MATLTKEKLLRLTSLMTRGSVCKTAVKELSSDSTKPQFLQQDWVGDESSGFTQGDLDARIKKRRVEAPKVSQREVVISLSELTDREFEVFLAGLPRNSKRKSAHHPK